MKKTENSKAAEVIEDPRNRTGYARVYVLAMLVDTSKPTISMGMWHSPDLGVRVATDRIIGGPTQAALAALKSALAFCKAQGYRPTLILEKRVYSSLEKKREPKRRKTADAFNEVLKLIDETSATLSVYERTNPHDKNAACVFNGESINAGFSLLRSLYDHDGIAESKIRFEHGQDSVKAGGIQG